MWRTCTTVLGTVSLVVLGYPTGASAATTPIVCSASNLVPPIIGTCPGPAGPAGPPGPQGPPGGQGTSTAYGLVITKTGNGTGQVSSPTGIDCGADCTEVYPPATVVALTAAPSNGSAFVGWSGDCSGSATCTVTMNAAKSVVAYFGHPGLSIDPASYNFGNVTQNTYSPPHTFTVANGGPGSTGVISLTAAGDGVKIQNDTCTGVVLATAASCTFDIVFFANGGNNMGNVTAAAAPGGSATAVFSITGSS